MNVSKHLAIAAAASLMAAACSSGPSQSGDADIRPLANTVWTAYYAGGVGIMAFSDSTVTDRFYDGITGVCEQSVSGCKVSDATISTSDGLTLYYRREGSSLRIYPTEEAYRDSIPSAIFRIL